MLQTRTNPRPQGFEKLETSPNLPSAAGLHPDRELDNLLTNLSPDTPWGDRQNAAQKLGSLADPQALTGLLDALPADPFWMVRSSIIQALEMIGDPKAVPSLRELAANDDFQAVRSHAAKAVAGLSRLS